METLYPDYAEQEGFDRLIGEFGGENLLEELNKKDADTVWLGNLVGLSDILLGLTPITRGGMLYGVIAEMIGKGGLSFPERVESSKTPIQLEMNIRENVSQILREIDFTRREAEVGQIDSGFVEERFGKIRLNIYNLLRTATNISEYTGMNIEKIKPVSNTVDVFVLISETSGKVKELADGMGIPVSFSFPDKGDAIIGLDVNMFETAFFEILHNALYFTREGNCIEIEGSANKTSVSVTVRDRGVGIAKENLPHVFRPYFACGHGMNHAGIGLGLTLAKERIEAMDGKIKIKSTENVGTVVTITFNRKKNMNIVSKLHSSDKYTVLDNLSHLYVNLVDAKMSPYNPVAGRHTH